ncbi:MAG: endo-1,4-beta-xylanase [Oscillospiraceae bacterium]|nr:endo-1,4-beta-xylanase [Oscillospiraceae bacterium]
MRKIKFITAAFLLIVFSMNMAASAASGRQWDLTLPSLKDSFAEYFGIGNIIEPPQVAMEAMTDMFKHHYNFVTAENAMKPSNMSREQGVYRFTETDFLVNWAIENDIQVVGHALVWHSQSAGWLTIAEDGGPVTRAEARANMEDYINAVAGHFAGRIYSWDVVNEAFITSITSAPLEMEEGWWKGRLRKQLSDTENRPSWYAAYANGADEEAGEDGSDYIYDAFIFARAADPNAILYYNDFNETDAGKREAIAQMVEELNEKWESDPQNTEPGRLLIEGIGMQAHYWTANLSPVSVELTILRFAETGAVVSISELDIPIGSWNNYGEATKENLERQAELYGELFEIFIKHSDKIERVTFWGKMDSQSWRSRGNPLLFDVALSAKPAFFSVIETAPEAVLPPEAAQPSESSGEEAEEPTPPPTATESAAPDFTESDTENSDFLLIIIASAGGVLLIIIGAVLIIKKRK